MADDFPTEIDAIPTGGGGITPAEPKDVNFYDYDGTCLYSYTAAEALALTALPDNPSHTGLTALGWNWTLAELQTQVNTCGMCDVGQMYVTDDGKTRLYIKIEYTQDLSVHLTWYQSVANGVIIDWGDGSAKQTFAGTTIADGTCVHTYSALGEYMITMTPASSSVLIRLGNNAASCGLMGTFVSSTSSTYGHTTSQKVLRKVECGSNIKRFQNYAFAFCSNLETITIANDLDYLSNSSIFWFCTSIVGIVMPRVPGITTEANRRIAANFIAYASSLKVLSISPTITSVGGAFSAYAYGLSRIVFPYTCTGLVSGSTVTTLFSQLLAAKHIVVSNFANLGPCTSICNGNRALIELNLPANAAMTVASGAQFGTAFSYCSSLRRVWLPAATQYISANAFQYCGSMEELHIRSTTPPTITTTTFSTMNPECKFYVPVGTGDAYKAAPIWSTYASRIYEEST